MAITTTPTTVTVNIASLRTLQDLIDTTDRMLRAGHTAEAQSALATAWHLADRLANEK